MDYQIIHYSNFGGHASEYIHPKGYIDITSHGIGSGIYGLSQEYLQKNPPNGNIYEKFLYNINNPYFINDNEDYELYSSSSKNLMRKLQKITHENCSVDHVILKKLSKKFVNKIGKFTVKSVTTSLVNFWHDYHTRFDCVEMPINYILKNNGYDGVVFKVGTHGHRWSAGNVKFINYPTYKKGDKIPVHIILTRKGISTPMTNLLEYNYRYFNNDNEIFYIRN